MNKYTQSVYYTKCLLHKVFIFIYSKKKFKKNKYIDGKFEIKEQIPKAPNLSHSYRKINDTYKLATSANLQHLQTCSTALQNCYHTIVILNI